ncbi:hypothetical protein N657DRAFT_582078, partial [Parathielavia appendiculata]
LGLLDNLPVELFLNILESLDFPSLSRLSRVSLRANSVVLNLPAYRIVMKHAAGPLAVLTKTELLPYHSAAQLSKALRSSQCVLCQQVAAFLFLPTCERACGNCLSRKLAFALALPDQVADYFGLSKDKVATLPALVAIRGDYYADPQRVTHQAIMTIPVADEYVFVSVMQARELALRLGTCTNPMEFWRFERTNPFCFWAEETLPYEVNSLDDSAEEEYPSIDPEYMLPHIADADFQSALTVGLSHVRFPSVGPDGRVEYGQWCRGCIDMLECFMDSVLPAEIVEQARKDGLGGCPATHFWSHASRLWSSDSLRQHVVNCHGRRIIWRRWEEVLDQIRQGGFRLKKRALKKGVKKKALKKKSLK